MLFKHYSIEVKLKFKIINRKKFKENNFNGLEIYLFFPEDREETKKIEIIKTSGVKYMRHC